MATPSVSSLALFTPLVASNAIFSARRASRGVDAMDENPVLGAMNMTIAGAQIVDSTEEEVIERLKQAIKERDETIASLRERKGTILTFPQNKFHN